MRTLLMLTLAIFSGLSTSPAAAQKADRAVFDQAFSDYKQVVAQIEQLRSEFQGAPAARREELNSQLGPLVLQAQSKVNAMIDEAIKLYQAAPESDKPITDLLTALATYKVAGGGPKSQGGDQFEQALKIIRVLIDGGNQTPGLPSLGVVAAFCCNEYDLAEQYAALAAERNDDTSKLGDEVAGLAADYGDPARIAQYRKLWEREKELRAAEAAADDLPRVKFQTTKGDIVIELFENQAPIATANMISLVKGKFYDGTKFHRVLPHFMAQGGDPHGDGTGGPGHNIPCECYQDDARMHFRGSLSMAHAGRDTGGSQFFLTFVPTHHLNGRHTVFGRVIEGIEVLGELQRVNPGERGVEEDRIVKATVVRDRGHDYSDYQHAPAR